VEHRGDVAKGAPRKAQPRHELLESANRHLDPKTKVFAWKMNIKHDPLRLGFRV